jgi:hypothetical protein
VIGGSSNFKLLHGSSARQFGMAVRCEGGSHHVFSHGVVTDIVSIPAHRPVKPVYVRQFVVLVDKVKESQT